MPFLFFSLPLSRIQVHHPDTVNEHVHTNENETFLGIFLFPSGCNQIIQFNERSMFNVSYERSKPLNDCDDY